MTEEEGLMTPTNHELDRLRQGRSELENHYIDELVAGRLSRRDFLRRGSMVGLSVPLLGAILSACGSSGSSSTAPPPHRQARRHPPGGDLHPGRGCQPADGFRCGRPVHAQPDGRVPDL